MPGERAGPPVDLGRRRLARDRPFEVPRRREQAGPAGPVRQGGEPLDHRAREFAHFIIFELADDAAVPDRAGIVDRDIIEQAPGRLDRGVVGARRRGKGEDEQQEQAKANPLQTQHAV